MNVFRCFAALLLLPLCAHAAEGDAFKRVANAGLFAFGGIGIAGITSDSEIAFREVLASNTAVPDLERLLKTGNVQAQCYALVGLRLKQRAVFDEKIKEFIASRAIVETAAGCVMAKRPMSSVVAGIRKGDYDQQARRELKR